MKREKLFTMRMSEDESARMDLLAKHFELTGAGVIRMLLLDKARELEGDLQLPRPRKGSKR